MRHRSSVLLGLLLTMALEAAAATTAGHESAGPARNPPPNIVVVFCDDMGYGDLSCFGHPTIRTPHLDRMAAEGIRFTQFYSAAPVCTPSRAALLTGRLPIRNGMCGNRRRVLFPDSVGGLPDGEVTLAEALQERGYATACVGKWHLGHLPRFLPTSHGFDSYFGIPYSNDMDRVAAEFEGEERFRKWNVPLLRGVRTVERPADQRTITRRYTDEAVAFIRSQPDRPFFLYLAHNMPHVPLFASDEFVGKSPRGLYGDVIEEIDSGVGRILETLRESNLDRRTIVWFTSDNGPWLQYGVEGGSAGSLRDGKGSTWEGGMRVPAIAWWPGRIPAGTVTQELAATLDIYTTSIELAGGDIPDDRAVDGVDLRPVLFGNGLSPRKTMFYYRGTRLMAVRKGPWKAHLITQPAYGGGGPTEHDPPLLFHLDHDPSERHDLSRQHPEVIGEIRRLVEEHRKGLVVPELQLDVR